MTHAHPAGLELSFRRLLARYPAPYRAAREDEMIATLMESAEPGQERPTTRDTLDLTAGAVRAHLRHGPLPALADGVAAAAMPAALLLIGVLSTSLFSVLGVLAITATDADLGMSMSTAEIIGRNVLRSAAPIIAAVALAAALLARRNGAARAVAAVIAIGWLGAAAVDLPVNSGFTVENALVPGLLAALVAAAPSNSLSAERRLGRPTALALLVLAPLVTVVSIATFLVQSTKAVPVPNTPDEVIAFGIAAFAVAVLTGAVALLRRGARLGALLFVVAVLPQVALDAMMLTYSSTQWTIAAVVATAVTLPATAAALISARLRGVRQDTAAA